MKEKRVLSLALAAALALSLSFPAGAAGCVRSRAPGWVITRWKRLVLPCTGSGVRPCAARGRHSNRQKAQRNRQNWEGIAVSLWKEVR